MSGQGELLLAVIAALLVGACLVAAHYLLRRPE